MMRSRVLISILLVLVAAQTLCCCTTIGAPQPPYAITPSEDAVERFQERVQSIDPSDGLYTLTLSEEEMTSLVQAKLAEPGGAEVVPVSATQVYFLDGHVEAYGDVRLNDSLTAPGMVAFSLDTADGELVATIEEVKLGALPVPQTALASLNEMLNDALVNAFTVDGKEVTFTEIIVGEGEMTLTAQLPSD